jgi:hypothetical protein
MIREGEMLEEGDLIDLLTPISSISLKSEEEVKSFSGVSKLKVVEGQIKDISALGKSKASNGDSDDIVGMELVGSGEFDVMEFLKSKELSNTDIDHIVDHKVLINEVPQSVEFYHKGLKLGFRDGSLVVGINDLLEIKKYAQTVSFALNVYIFQSANISKYTSYPKDFSFVGVDDNGLLHIKKEKTLEYAIEL